MVVDFFGPRYGLPPAISKHNQYWIWGPRNYTVEIMIVLKSVQDVGTVEHPYSRRDEWFHIFLCRGPKFNLQDVWPRMNRRDAPQRVSRPGDRCT